MTPRRQPLVAYDASDSSDDDGQEGQDEARGAAGSVATAAAVASRVACTADDADVGTDAPSAKRRRTTTSPPTTTAHIHAHVNFATHHLVHLYVPVALHSYPRLSSVLRKARRVLERQRVEAGTSRTRLIWLYQGDEGGDGNDDDDDDTGELHISLSNPLLIPRTSTTAFLTSLRDAMFNAKIAPFSLCLSRFTPLPSSSTSTLPPRVYHTLEVGQGHDQLMELAQRIDAVIQGAEGRGMGVVGQGYSKRQDRGQTTKFHASWAAEENEQEQEPEQMQEQQPRRDDGDNRLARAKTLSEAHLESRLGDLLRGSSVGLRARCVCIKVGPRVVRCELGR